MAELLRPGRAGSNTTADHVVEADDDIGLIEGWPSGLRLAVDNLVRNAITHGDASRIVLAAHAKRIVLSCTRPMPSQTRLCGAAS